jgi:hypothetical protein
MRRGGERTALREAHDMGSGVAVPAWTRVTWPRMEWMPAGVDRELLCRFWGADERGNACAGFAKLSERAMNMSH